MPQRARHRSEIVSRRAAGTGTAIYCYSARRRGSASCVQQTTSQSRGAHTHVWESELSMPLAVRSALLFGGRRQRNVGGQRSDPMDSESRPTPSPPATHTGATGNIRAALCAHTPSPPTLSRGGFSQREPLGSGVGEHIVLVPRGVEPRGLRGAQLGLQDLLGHNERPDGPAGVVAVVLRRCPRGEIGVGRPGTTAGTGWRRRGLRCRWERAMQRTRHTFRISVGLAWNDPPACNGPPSPPPATRPRRLS